MKPTFIALLALCLCLPLASGCKVLPKSIRPAAGDYDDPDFFKKHGVLKGTVRYLLNPVVWLDAYAGANSGSTSVKGYTKKDGTYVAPHYRSKADSSFENNWSTKGSVNPYTGKAGSRKAKP